MVMDLPFVKNRAIFINNEYHSFAKSQVSHPAGPPMRVKEKPRPQNSQQRVKSSARMKIEKSKGDSATRRERYEDKEDAIIKAAHESFGQKGFTKTTISQIAASAGVAEGTVYLYFNNKNAIASAVIARFYDRLTKSTQSGVDALQSTAQKLEFLAIHHLTSVLEERRILEMLNLQERHQKSDRADSLYMMNKNYVGIFDRTVREGILKGDIAKGYAPWILRDIFYGGLENAMRTIVITGRDNEVEQFSRQLVKLLLVSKPRKGAFGEKTDKKLLKIADRLDAIADRMEKNS